MATEEVQEKFLEALASRDFESAVRYATELGEEIPREYFDLEPINKEINTINKKQFTKLFVDENNNEYEIEKEIINNATNKKYTALILGKPARFKDYKYQEIAPEFEDPNFENEKDAENIKELFNTTEYTASTRLNKYKSVIMQQTKNNMNYFILTHTKDKDGDIRSELSTIVKKIAPIENCIELLVEDKNYERPGLILPIKNYDWKQELINAYRSND